MVKRLTLIISILLLFSCGTRKVNVSKIDEQIKVDSSLVIKVDGTYVKENNIFITESIDEIEYKPLDTLKPMKIDGKEYINTVIKTKKHNKKTIDTTKQKSIVKIDKKVDVKKEGRKKVFNKVIKKPTNYWAYLWLLLPIFIIWLIEKYGKLIFPFFRFLK